MARTFTLAAVVTAATIACAQTADEDLAAGDSDLTASESETVRRLVRGMSTERLVAEVGIRRVAAEAIRRTALGPDGVAGTEDDETFSGPGFGDAAEVVGRLPQVGELAEDALRAYARAHRELGSIRGTLLFGTEAPAFARVVAFRADGTATYEIDVVPMVQYEIAVPEGEYFVAAYSAGRVGAFTPAVPCGLHAGCTDHFAAKVRVTAGDDAEDISIEFDRARRVPREPVPGAPPGCGSLTFRGACFGETLVWCEERVPRSQDCRRLSIESPKRCAFQSEAVGFNCVAADGTVDR